ncbi:4Fe-4S cluster-binding domain-containing protein, partial [Photobacterium sp. OFAV2-7]
MNYLNYYPVDVVNGPGTRCTLFVSGCEHQCRGCYNKNTWRLDCGHPFTQEMEDQIISDLNDTRIKRRGLSLSGGDPLHPANL